jgi:hypothetical protein
MSAIAAWMLPFVNFSLCEACLLTQPCPLVNPPAIVARVVAWKSQNESRAVSESMGGIYRLR